MTMLKVAKELFIQNKIQLRTKGKLKMDYLMEKDGYLELMEVGINYNGMRELAVK